MRRRSPLAVIGPGLLVAATGVGAGDLATASIAGSKLGVAVLWAVVAGAGLKFVLNEGLARWQLATGETLLEGVVRHLGRPVGYLFLLYLTIWSFAVARALASACGVTAHALFPVFEEAATGKVVFGIVHGLAGVALVLIGGYRLFERVMSVCIGVMFLTVVITAGILFPEPASVARGLVLPSIPMLGEGGLAWTVALLGGVGGTVTLLCYGYWIREEGRSGPDHLTPCRLDLAAGYLVTGLFGIAMVIIGERVEIEGGGAALLVSLADRLELAVGRPGRWLFLAGAWGAVASSLLGVWQAVPYLFGDLSRLLSRNRAESSSSPLAEGLPYRLALLALGVASVAGLFTSFVRVQQVYAVLGALFIPMLALVLLLLNGRRDLVGPELRNKRLTVVVLMLSLGLFLGFGYLQVAAG